MLTMEGWRNHPEWQYVRDSFSPRVVLDYGCGSGHPALWLVRHGFDVWGFDPDPIAIQIAEKAHSEEDAVNRQRVHFSDAFPYALKCDMIWCSHVLEHISLEQWGTVFKHFWSTTAEFALLSVPADHAFDDETHVNHWATKEDFASCLRSYGDIRWLSHYPEDQVFRGKVCRVEVKQA